MSGISAGGLLVRVHVCMAALICARARAKDPRAGSQVPQEAQGRDTRAHGSQGIRGLQFSVQRNL